jgi:nicotinate-nucleotide adenylyltransferase
VRIAVLGGVFDPPHVGHLVIAQEAWWRLGLDRVLLVPAGSPPDRPAATYAAADRLRMLRRAVEGHPGLAVSRAEIDRPGPSFTVDTLQAVADEHPGAALWFVLGADRLEGFAGWHRPERILELARLAVVPRNGVSAEDVVRIGDRVAPGAVDVVDAPEIRVSSTMLRERIAAGAPLRYLVPPGVEALLGAPRP